MNALDKLQAQFSQKLWPRESIEQEFASIARDLQERSSKIKENLERDVLHAKRWIDYISVKSRCEKNNKVRTDIVYLPDAFQDI